MNEPSFLKVDRTVFLIKHRDGFIRNTTKNAFQTSEARVEAKKYHSWQAALNMARKCGANEIQEVSADNCYVITRRYEVMNG